MRARHGWLWIGFARCESRPTARCSRASLSPRRSVSRSQFDYPTWQAVGGTGDPAVAPPEEQDARARELYARRGPQPWPECGRFLE
ncbi:MAG: hypothetical protein EBY44_08100 [Actinobacteria bacterium]|nr:hypothetical protein [Actinomycetota bacterium]